MTQWRQQKATSNQTPTETGTRYSQHPACRSSSETTETQPSNSSQYPLHSPRETIGAQHRPSPLQSNTVARAFDMGLRRRRTQRTNQHTKTHVESQTLAAPRHKHRPLSTSRRKRHERRLRLHRELLRSLACLHQHYSLALFLLFQPFFSDVSSRKTRPSRHCTGDINSRYVLSEHSATPSTQRCRSREQRRSAVSSDATVCLPGSNEKGR